MAVVAGAVGVDLEVAVVVDMIAVLTEVAEVDQEEEEAWGKCLIIIHVSSPVLVGLLDLRKRTESEHSDACKCFLTFGYMWSSLEENEVGESAGPRL